MCRCNRCDIAFQMARRLSDQDIMPRYRMTPPVRGRCPSPDNAERTTCAKESGGKRARRTPRVTRPFAAADVDVIELLALRELARQLNLVDPVVKTRGL